MKSNIIKGSLGEIIAEELRRSIWKREIGFGERLIENELSAKYDVSRNVIRDALKILENDGMVVIEPRKGTYVSDFSDEDWKEIIDLRLMVESYAFLKALPHLENPEFIELQSILDKMKYKDSVEDWMDLFDLDMKFHSYIVSLSGNSRIIKLYESIKVQIRTFLLYLDEYYTSPRAFYEEQEELMKALLTKEPKIVENKIHTHIKYVEGKFLG